MYNIDRTIKKGLNAGKLRLKGYAYGTNINIYNYLYIFYIIIIVIVNASSYIFGGVSAKKRLFYCPKI